MKVMALECWRIKKLIPEFKDNRKHLVLKTSVDRMTDALDAWELRSTTPRVLNSKMG